MEQVIARELELLGSHGMAAHAYPRMLEMIAAGRLAPQQLIARIVSLADVAVELPRLAERSAAGMVVARV
jgi:alcohol dehydrogenase